MSSAKRVKLRDLSEKENEPPSSIPEVKVKVQAGRRPLADSNAQNTFKLPAPPTWKPKERTSSRATQRINLDYSNKAATGEIILSPRTKQKILATPTKLPAEAQLLTEKQITLQNEETSQIKQGKHSAVSFVTTTLMSPKTRNFALKKSDLAPPSGSQPNASKTHVTPEPSLMYDRSYRELLTFQILNRLRDMTDYYPSPEFCNFIRLRDIWIGKDSPVSFESTLSSSAPPLHRKQLYLLLEKADMTLAELFSVARQTTTTSASSPSTQTPTPFIELVTGDAMKTVSFYQLRCLMFQILFGLHAAQQEFEFSHNDLHFSVCYTSTYALYITYMVHY